MGALTEILRTPGGIEIGTIHQSPMSDAQLNTDLNRRKLADAYLEALAASGLRVENLTEPGREMRLDGLHLKVLQVNDTTMLVNALQQRQHRAAALGQAQIAADARRHGRGERRPSAAQRSAGGLDCDYIQMAHHGQMGVRERVLPHGPLPRLPLADAPVGVEQRCGRRLRHSVDEDPPRPAAGWTKRGITEHHCAWQGGLVKIE